MKPQVITFDAAETLIKVDWAPGRFAVEVAQEAGHDMDSQVAREVYDRLLQTRWREYCALNQTRDETECDRFWWQLTYDWLERIGVDTSDTDRVVALARQKLYSPDSLQFRLFDDVKPVLTQLRDRGYRLAVISNWDYSLHRIVRQLGIYDYFELVVASLEEGPEKPDPRLFHGVLAQLDVPAEQALHVGDNPLDDYQGARGAGMRAVLLDRQREIVEPPAIPSLWHLEEALSWTS